MTRKPRTALIGLAVLTGLAGLTLAACGSDEDTATTTTAADSATTAPATDDAATDDDATDDSSSEDADSGSSGAVVDICSVLTVDDVAAIVGGPVTVETQPGGGCNFSQEDLSAPSMAFASTDVGSDDTDGTFNESRVGAFGVLTDPTKEEPGIGDYSAVASGTIGGENQQGVGLAQTGQTLVQVTVLQGVGLDGAAVRSLASQGLTLAVSLV